MAQVAPAAVPVTLPASETVSVEVAAARLGLSRGKAYELARLEAFTWTSAMPHRTPQRARCIRTPFDEVECTIPFHAELIAMWKEAIPYSRRSYDPGSKAWRFWGGYQELALTLLLACVAGDLFDEARLGLGGEFRGAPRHHGATRECLHLADLSCRAGASSADQRGRAWPHRHIWHSVAKSSPYRDTIRNRQTVGPHSEWDCAVPECGRSCGPGAPGSKSGIRREPDRHSRSETGQCPTGRLCRPGCDGVPGSA